MINGIFLGVLTWISLLMTFTKWPLWAKRLAMKNELLTDILAGLSIWALLGVMSKTLTAVIGAAMAEILLVLTLHWYKGQHDTNKIPR